MTSETEAVARNWIVAGVVVLVLAVAGAAVALAADDDGESAHSAPNTSSRAPTTAPAPSTTAPVTTVAPVAPDTTAAATTTLPPAGTPPGSCGAETGAIRAAVDAGVPGAQDGAHVNECRLAAIDPTWAITRLGAKPGAEFAATTVLLHSVGGAWTIVDSGTDDVGCGAAPQQVLVDLGLFCTGTGGGTP